MAFTNWKKRILNVWSNENNKCELWSDEQTPTVRQFSRTRTRAFRCTVHSSVLHCIDQILIYVKTKFIQSSRSAVVLEHRAVQHISQIFYSNGEWMDLRPNIVRVHQSKIGYSAQSICVRPKQNQLLKLILFALYRSVHTWMNECECRLQ